MKLDVFGLRRHRQSLTEPWPTRYQWFVMGLAEKRLSHRSNCARAKRFRWLCTISLSCPLASVPRLCNGHARMRDAAQPLLTGCFITYSGRTCSRGAPGQRAAAHPLLIRRSQHAGAPQPREALPCRSPRWESNVSNIYTNSITAVRCSSKS